jgi:cytochrome c oxidase cbb3-type subunit 4
MDINDFRAYITLATFLTFLGICWWAYRGGNKERFEEDAMLAFAPDEVAEGKGAMDGRQARERRG